MTFAQDLSRFGTTTVQDLNATFVATVADLRDSIKFGSSQTGAPAMPVAPGAFKHSGALRDSITVSYPDAITALIYTTKPYALDVEDNAKGHTFVSGGPHGWKLTVAAFGRVLSTNAARIAGYRR